MRYLAVLFTAFALGACSAAPVTRTASHADSPTPAVATDFHTHGTPDPVRFRDVRIGHVMTPGGEEQYMLCGQFLPAQGGSDARWTHFVTIKTSGYEQWIGTQAASFCQGSSVIWDTKGDLSSSLQSRLDSLR